MENKNNDKLYCPLIHDYCRDDCVFTDSDPHPESETYCILRFAGMFFSDHNDMGMDYISTTLDNIETNLEKINETLRLL